MKIGRMAIERKAADCWVGVFWRHTEAQTDDGQVRLATDIWICIVPCFPLHITLWRAAQIPFDTKGQGGTIP